MIFNYYDYYYYSFTVQEYKFMFFFPFFLSPPRFLIALRENALNFYDDYFYFNPYKKRNIPCVCVYVCEL